MGRTKAALWSHFISLEQNEGDLLAYFNKSHKNAWCKYCIDHAIQNQLGNDEDMAEFDSSLGTRSNHFIRQRRCMRAMKPVRGIYELMAKHLHDCVHRPNSVNVPNLPAIDTNNTPSQSGQSSQSGRASQLERGQSILHLKTKPRVFSKEAKAEFHTDFLRMWIAIGASYWSADQPEVRNFFEKWVGMKNPSRYQCRGPLLKAQVQMLDQNMKEKISGKEGTLTCDG